MVRPSSKAGFSGDQMTFSWMETDAGKIPLAARTLVDAVRKNPTTVHFLISCGKHKLSTAALAEDLYTSPRFKSATGIPKRMGTEFSVLSAKHGLLDPRSLVEPYDLSLSTLPPDSQLQWAAKVASDIKIRMDKSASTLIFLADDEYRKNLIPLLLDDFEVVDPFSGMDRSSRMAFLRYCHRLLDRELAISSLYELFWRLADERTLVTLREAMTAELPAQGVYFFFDPAEPTRFSNNLARLVRVGTHAVSSGSKATLRDRLRTHLGTSDGGGNHRSSVFRLHVGEALIRKNDLRNKFPHWGNSKNVDKAICASERELEIAVSEYIGELQLLCVDVADKAHKNSARSQIERLSIALMTEDFIPVEPPSAEWLGLFSAHDVIAKTGLWNVREVGTKADLGIGKIIASRFPATSARGL